MAYETLDSRRVGQRILEKSAKISERVMKARAEIGEERFFDISFRAMMNNPIATVKALYERLGLKMTPETERRMSAFLESQRLGKHSGHRYTLEQFGLHRGTVEQKLAPYRERFAEFL